MTPLQAFKDLQKHQTAWSIYAASRKIFPSRFNTLITVIAFFASGLFAELVVGDAGHVLQAARELVRLVFGGAISLLGFFITGFALIAAFSDKHLLISMALKEHTKYGISYFKYNYFVFLRVFLTTLAIGAFALGLIIGLGPGTGLGSRMGGENSRTVLSAASLSLAMVFTFQVVLLLVAKTFVINVYVSVVTAMQATLIERLKSRPGGNPTAKN